MITDASDAQQNALLGWDWIETIMDELLDEEYAAPDNGFSAPAAQSAQAFSAHNPDRADLSCA